jgi:hypothetical protein
MVPTMSQPGGRRQGPACAGFATNFGGPAPAPASWLIIIKALGLPDKGRSPPAPVHHATFVSTHCLRIPARRVRGLRRQPRFHHCQSGRRLWRRPVPRQGREMRRPCRPLLLPVTGFCSGHRLPARRSRRDYRRGSRQREMLRFRLRGIRRHYLPALNRSAAADFKGRFATPMPRKRRDAAPRSSYVRRPWYG